jgi:hypothetical protein
LPFRNGKPTVSFMLERQTPFYQVDGDELFRLLEHLGYRSDDAKAEFLGISPAVVSRIRNATQNQPYKPSNRTMAAICVAFPRVDFGRLFNLSRKAGASA